MTRDLSAEAEYRRAIKRAEQNLARAKKVALDAYIAKMGSDNTREANCVICGHLRAWHGTTGCNCGGKCKCPIKIPIFSGDDPHGKEM